VAQQEAAAVITGPYLLYVKLGAAAALLAGAAGVGWHFGGLAKDDAFNRYKTDVQAQRATQLSALASAWQNRELQTQAKDARHDAEMATLQAVRNNPLPGVALSVCPSTPGPIVFAGGSETTQPAGAGSLPAGNGSVPRASGDIRPGLLRIADEADVQIANCRETQPATARVTP
jgi:hypothetical protein